MSVMPWWKPVVGPAFGGMRPTACAYGYGASGLMVRLLLSVSGMVLSVRGRGALWGPSVGFLSSFDSEVKMACRKGLGRMGRGACRLMSVRACSMPSRLVLELCLWYWNGGKGHAVWW